MTQKNVEERTRRTGLAIGIGKGIIDGVAVGGERRMRLRPTRLACTMTSLEHQGGDARTPDLDPDPDQGQHIAARTAGKNCLEANPLGEVGLLPQGKTWREMKIWGILGGHHRGIVCELVLSERASLHKIQIKNYSRLEGRLYPKAEVVVLMLWSEKIGSAGLKESDRPRIVSTNNSSTSGSISIKGLAVQQASAGAGFTIKGSANARELFPGKLGPSNAGKELFSSSASGKKRQKAEDLFG